MKLKGVKLGFGFTGAYSVFDQVFPQLQRLIDEGAEIVPIISYQVAKTDSRYGNATDFLQKIEEITGRKVIQSMSDAEAFNKQEQPIDLFIIAPCTGNSLSKLADGATDTPVLMVAKELFRNSKPILLGIATNDGLGISARNIGSLLATKNVYFIPYGQDDFRAKPMSLVSKFELMVPSILEAINNQQIQPILEMY